MNFISKLCNLEEKIVILASKSPRRIELLNRCGLVFRHQKAEVPENPANYHDEIDYVHQSALIKASWVWERHEADLIISADTIVFKAGQIIEKPADADEAKDILRTLSGATHQVITGFCLKNQHQQIVDHEITKVTFHPLSESEIDLYLETGESFDKAGGYGIQGFSAVFIEKVEGCYFNVMGFPVGKFYQRLKGMEI